MSLEVGSTREKGITVVTPRGRLILQNGTLLHDEVKRVVADGARRVLIDLSHVEYIDSHGLGQLVACQSTLRSQEGQVRFAGLSQKLYRLLEMTRIPDILHFDSDRIIGLTKLSGS